MVAFPWSHVVRSLPFNNNNDSKESKVTRVTFSSCKKVPIAFGDEQFSARHGTLQCSAGPEWYGCHGTTDTLTSTWAPAVGQPVRVRWVPHNMEKSKPRCTCIPNTINTIKNFPTFLAKSQYIMYDECAGSVRAMRWRMRPWTSRETNAMKSLTRVHHFPFAQNIQSSIPIEC